MKPEKIAITGADLKISDIVGLIRDENAKIEISQSAKNRIVKSYDFLNQEIANKIVYGANTGFGPMASHSLAKGQLLELQFNLIRSHAVGMGNPLPIPYILAAMVVRLNTLAKGYSGVSSELLDLLAAFINMRIIPVVPEHGAVGTSGDLVQLAHIALALIGEGRVVFQGIEMSTAEALQKTNLKAHKLQPKEGLALINGTSFMSGIGAVICDQASRLLNLAQRTGALALELVQAFDDGISEKLHSLRPHGGQVAIATNLRKLLESSKALRRRSVLKDHLNSTDDVREMPAAIQEIYSLRCIPQILGPVLDTLRKTQADIQTEINSVTDNPIVDWETEEFYHGGNFHGDQIASTLDFLKIAVTKMTMLSERRINFFLNRNVNKIFPPFLNLKKPGLTLGLQGLQFVATSTTAQSQSLAFPHHIHSIPTNGDNQDVVSMGTDAALLTAKVIENAFIVLSIESITLAQAVDFKNDGQKLCAESKKFYDAVRELFPKIVDDREIISELRKITQMLKDASEFDL